MLILQKLITRAFFVLALILCTGWLSVKACTDFRLTAKDGTVLITRSMEFAVDMKANLRTVHREQSFSNTTPTGKPGLSWQAKYGYLYLDAFDIPMVVDGMNEVGLSFEALYLPGETTYETVADGKEANALAYYRMGDWILGNFKTIAEVKAALSNIIVFAEKIKGLGDMIFPLHFIIYDATGKSIVLEYIDGKPHVYDNQLGVATNAPTYDWHVTNLRNYTNLTPHAPKPISIAGITFNATGQGSGMLGLPGDVSPPSRFVKTAVLLASVVPANDATQAINLAEHIINNVDIPMGLVRETEANGSTINEFTQWVVFKNLTKREFFYRTYNNLSLQKIELERLDFSKDAHALKMSISGPAYVNNVTAAFLKTAK